MICRVRASSVARSALALVVALASCGFALAGPSFTGLGHLSDGVSTRAEAISADGSVVVGISGSVFGSADTQAFRWTAATGMVGLGDLPGGISSSRAYGVSADGSVIVGDSVSESGREAFRWTAAEGMTGLGDFPGGTFSSTARDISADGSVIVGSGITADRNEAFRWTAAGGMIGLGTLYPPNGWSQAYGISADGSVIVGNSDFSTAFLPLQFRWTAGRGMALLERLPGYGHDPYARAIATSANGNVIVGGSAIGGPITQPFRWTSDGITLLLGGLGAGEAVSADGSIMVGYQEGAGAFTWDEVHGARSLRDVIQSLGVDLTGWTLTGATGISADGMTITGYGINPRGAGEAWIATIPEPAMLWLAILTSALAMRARRGGLRGLSGRVLCADFGLRCCRRRLRRRHANRLWPMLGRFAGLYTRVAFLIAALFAAHCHAWPGEIHSLGTLGSDYSEGLAINAAGVVTGSSYVNPPTYQHAFIYSGRPGAGGTMVDLGNQWGAPFFGQAIVGTFGRAINASGQVAGLWRLGDGQYVNRAFLARGTPLNGFIHHDLGTLGGTQSTAHGINAASQVVGSSGTSGMNIDPHAFLYSGTPGIDGAMHDLGTLGGNTSAARGINDSGHITGSSNLTPGGPSHAFFYSGTPGIDGQIFDLGTLGGTFSHGHAINNAGQIAGISSTADGKNHFFLYTGTPGVDGVMHDLGNFTDGATGLLSAAINSRGDVVGTYFDSTANRPFLYTGTPGADGHVIDLNAWLRSVNPAAPFNLRTAAGISDNGWITGRAEIGGSTGILHAYLLDASALVPEPSPLTLLVGAMLVTGCRFRPREQLHGQRQRKPQRLQHLVVLP